MKLDEETGKSLRIHLFKNVENGEEIKKKLLQGQLNCCILKPELIVDPFQIMVAANKAVLNDKFLRLTTRNIYTELLYSLSISKNISQSLLTFGVGEKDRNMIVVTIFGNEDKSLDEDVLSQIEGEQVDLGNLQDFTDPKLVRKVYKIAEDELNISSLVDSVVSRMSTKEFASLK